jgi:hypothetical protein
MLLRLCRIARIANTDNFRIPQNSTHEKPMDLHVHVDMYYIAETINCLNFRVISGTISCSDVTLFNKRMNSVHASNRFFGTV